MFRKIPRIGKRLFHHVKRKYNMLGQKHQCNICQQRFRWFLPYKDGWKTFSSFVLELGIIDSDVENFYCPVCSSFDRERHLFMYFDQLGIWSKMSGAAILHFAPEKHLARSIADQKPATYVKADLNPRSQDIQAIDICQIPFGDKSFDMIICNHVLEHIEEDKKALAEVSRLLKPNGLAILQTPHTNLLKNTFCDPAINTDELRRRFYGQEDHLRCYGRDLFRRIKEAGFSLQVKTHSETLSSIDAKFHGVNPDEVFILAEKV